MSLPVSTHSNAGAQPSIRSFFQPRQPTYAPPPTQAKQSADADAPPLDKIRPGRAPNNPPPEPISLLPSRTPAVSANSSSIPREGAIRRAEEADISALRRVNSLLLPVAFPDVFYQRVLDPTRSGLFSRVITWADSSSQISTAPKVVGGIVCRVEPSPFNPTAQPEEHALYIQSLCLLSPYRSFGLAATALEEIIAAAVTSTGINVTTVYAHAWTENDEGLRWYESRGFKRGDKPIEGYYFKLRPNSAWIVQRDVATSTAAPASNYSSAQSSQTVPLGVTAAIANLPPMSGPPPTGSPLISTPPSRTPSGQSYQNARPETEWNDLPQDMAASMLVPPRANGGSGASSRSSSTARKKKDRSYPAAAFSS